MKFFESLLELETCGPLCTWIASLDFRVKSKAVVAIWKVDFLWKADFYWYIVILLYEKMLLTNLAVEWITDVAFDFRCGLLPSVIVHFFSPFLLPLLTHFLFEIARIINYYCYFFLEKMSSLVSVVSVLVWAVLVSSQLIAQPREALRIVVLASTARLLAIKLFLFGFLSSLVDD